MPKYKCKIIERHQVADGTMSVFLSRPDGFEFKAGQFVTLKLSDSKPAQEDRRTFSITSPPQSKKHFEVSFRMTGSVFKNELINSPAGTEVLVVGPAGSCILNEDSDIAGVFIAGGIGITPFRSIIHDVISRKLSHSLTLIYSNRTVESAAYHAEFLKLTKEHNQFRYLPTITDSQRSKAHWDGERRPIDAALLSEVITDFGQTVFYVAGAPAFVHAIQQTLIKLQVEESCIISDEFFGY